MDTVVTKTINVCFCRELNPGRPARTEPLADLALPDRLFLKHMKHPGVSDYLS
jgi:hypothetical protein